MSTTEKCTGEIDRSETVDMIDNMVDFSVQWDSDILLSKSIKHALVNVSLDSSAVNIESIYEPVRRTKSWAAPKRFYRFVWASMVRRTLEKNRAF